MNAGQTHTRSARAIVAAALSMLLLAIASPVSPQGSTGALKVTSAPGSAQITVKGKNLGLTPRILELPIGRHKVTLEKAGFTTVTKTVKITADKLARSHFRLAARFDEPSRENKPTKTSDEIQVHAADEKSSPGTVTIVTTPAGLTVFMNDYLVPQPTPVAFDLRPGTYDLTIEEDGEVVHEKTVFVQAGKTLSMDLTIKKVRKIDYGDPWE